MIIVKHIHIKNSRPTSQTSSQPSIQAISKTNQSTYKYKYLKITYNINLKSMAEYLVDSMTDYLSESIAEYLVVFMADYFIDSTISLDWLLGWLLVGCENCRLFDWLHEWLLSWLVESHLVKTTSRPSCKPSSHSWPQSHSRQFSQPSISLRSQSSEVEKLIE